MIQKLKVMSLKIHDLTMKVKRAEEELKKIQDNKENGRKRRARSPH
jgi:hypothetical protein